MWAGIGRVESVKSSRLTSLVWDRQKEIQDFFEKIPDSTIVLKDVESYFKWPIGYYDLNEYRLYLDSLTSSFKAALCYNRDNDDYEIRPEVRILYSTESKENYQDMKKVWINKLQKSPMTCCRSFKTN